MTWAAKAWVPPCITYLGREKVVGGLLSRALGQGRRWSRTGDILLWMKVCVSVAPWWGEAIVDSEVTYDTLIPRRSQVEALVATEGQIRLRRRGCPSSSPS
jgi:hypothetical protein